MGRPTKIEITKGRTINLGNYNSYRVEYSLEVEIAEGDPLEKTKKKYEAIVDAWIEEENVKRGKE